MLFKILRIVKFKISSNVCHKTKKKMIKNKNLHALKKQLGKVQPHEFK